MLGSGIVHVSTDNSRSDSSQSLDDRYCALSLVISAKAESGGEPARTYLNQGFERRDSSLQYGMKHQVRLQNAHGSESTLNVGDCDAIL